MQTSFLLDSENLIPKDGSVILFHDYMKCNYQDLRQEIKWKHESIKLFGRQVLQPRLTAWYGDEGTEYLYSGLINVPLPWTDTLLEIKKRVFR